MAKIDDNIAAVLKIDGVANAVVRVRTPWQLNYIARRFDVVAKFPFINSLGIRCDKREVTRLAAMSEVESVTAQGRVSALDEPHPASDALREGEASSNPQIPGEGEELAQILSRSLTGKGVTLCVLDTGVQPHIDISVPRDRIKFFSDFVGGGEHPYDDNGHGTFVTGVAAGGGLLSAGKVRGVAPDADIVALKVISASGETGAFKILEGMQWLYDHFRDYGIKVACMSFGADPLDTADPLKLGAEMLTRSGITVVCAAGNSGVGGLKSPGVSSEVITVGAVDEAFRVAPFSSSGVYQGVYRPDVYAPGVAVRGVEAGGTYAVMSGTSVSAPYVAGACCLLHERYSRLTPREAKRMILSSSKVVDGVRVFSVK